MAYYSTYYGGAGQVPPPMGGGGYPSNYPQQGYGGYNNNPYAAGASAAAGFPPNSGPPPVPGYGGYGGGYQQQQAYGGYQQQQQAYGGAYAGAVPGFTAPPQGLPMPPSRMYAQANQAFQPIGCQMQNLQMMMEQQNRDDPKYREYMQWKQQQARRGQQEQNDDEVAKLKEMLEYEKKKTQEALEKAANDDNTKHEMRARFVDELMRRQTVSGTFEDANGTVVAFKLYTPEDPVYKWFEKEKKLKLDDKMWDPLYDVEYLYHAMDGLGTNEQAIIDVTATRCNAQRQKIRLEFKTAYGNDLIDEMKKELSGDFKQSILACYEKPARYDAWEIKNAIYDLIKELKSELSGDFKETVLACYESPARYDAWCVKKAIYGLGTDERTLIEIMLTRTNEQICEMRDEYNKITYSKQKDPESSIEKDIKGDTSGDFKRLLISSTTGNRRSVDRAKLENAIEEVQHDGKFTGMFKINYDKLVDPTMAEHYAKELFEAGEDKWGTDEATFNRIFSTQDFYTLRSVYDKYVKITQRDILNSVDRETSGDFRRGLCAVAQSVKCRPKFFAEALHRSMKGLGTDDSTLIRICISRSEIDMVQIKACFLEQYKQTLWNFIKDDCSGDYRKLLQAIVGKN